MNVTHLHCSACEKTYQPGKLYNLCECGKPLLVAYDLETAALTLTREWLPGRESSLWRYREVLPLDDERNRLTLGEGMTPLLKASRLGAQLGLSNLFIKDEGVNPTGSFKARGMAVAISMAKELGEVAAREGEPDLIDKIADERVATTVEDLLAYLEEKGHPALGMPPIF